MNSFRFLQAGHRLRGPPAGRARSRRGGKVVQETRLFDPDARRDARRCARRRRRTTTATSPSRISRRSSSTPALVEAVAPDAPGAAAGRAPPGTSSDLGLSAYDARPARRRARDGRVLRRDARRLRRRARGGEEDRELDERRGGAPRERDRRAAPAALEAHPGARSPAILKLVDARTHRRPRREAGASRRSSASGGEPDEVVRAKGLAQVSDAGAIEAAVDQVLAASPPRWSATGREQEAHRLLRRAGDEGDEGQGEPRGGERAAEAEAGRLTRWRAGRDGARAPRARARRAGRAASSSSSRSLGSGVVGGPPRARRPLGRRQALSRPRPRCTSACACSLGRRERTHVTTREPLRPVLYDDAGRRPAARPAAAPGRGALARARVLRRRGRRRDQGRSRSGARPPSASPPPTRSPVRRAARRRRHRAARRGGAARRTRARPR